MDIHDSLGLPQPTVSRHLSRTCGGRVLVEVPRDGVRMHYRVSRTVPPAVQAIVDATFDALTRALTTAQDRKQFLRPFGSLYVMDSRAGGACCAPSR